MLWKIFGVDCPMIPKFSEPSQMTEHFTTRNEFQNHVQIAIILCYTYESLRQVSGCNRDIVNLFGHSQSPIHCRRNFVPFHIEVCANFVNNEILLPKLSHLSQVVKHFTPWDEIQEDVYICIILKHISCSPNL